MSQDEKTALKMCIWHPRYLEDLKEEAVMALVSKGLAWVHQGVVMPTPRRTFSIRPGQV